MMCANFISVVCHAVVKPDSTEPSRLAGPKWAECPGSTPRLLAAGGEPRRSYSARRVSAGLMRIARITGGSAASKAAAMMVSAGKASILGSEGFTW